MIEITTQAIGIFSMLNRNVIPLDVAERTIIKLLDQAYNTGVNDAIEQMRKDVADHKARNGR